MNSYSENMQAVYDKATEVAKQYGSAYISTEHFVYAMFLIDCKAGKILKSCGVNVSLYEVFFKHTISPSAAITGITPKMNGCLQRAKESSVNSGEKEIGSVSVLLAILSTDCQAVNILKALGVNINELIQQLETNA